MENKSANLSKASEHCFCLPVEFFYLSSRDFLFASTWQIGFCANMVVSGGLDHFFVKL